MSWPRRSCQIVRAQFRNGLSLMRPSYHCINGRPISTVPRNGLGINLRVTSY
jgi:hypothetical protein